ncbi:MAG TPA: hypothetical protein VK550_32955 [Polyangiaceae bacterium]|jgi:hypothetical protein|nr:hypothetical protein [Polyangiaceae bacterium]
MSHRSALRPLAGLVGIVWFGAAACGGSQRNRGQESQTGNDGVAASAPASSSTATPSEASSIQPPASSSLDALPPPDTDTSAKARRSLTLTESRGTVDPSSNAIPYPTRIDTPPQAGVAAAIKAVPSTIPVGTLSKSQLEAPLRDRAHFDHCRIPYGTHGEIAAVVYNGAALGVDVKTTPNDRALNFCIERSVRQMTWIKELAVNRVTVSF